MPLDRNYMIGKKTYVSACCNEIQFEYLCRNCWDVMGCYYCDFDYDVAHDCEKN